MAFLFQVSPADVTSFLDWRRRRQRVVDRFAPTSRGPTGLQVCIERVEYSRYLEVGVPSWIAVTVSNRGPDAWVAGVTVSFPTIASDGDGAYTSVVAAGVIGRREPGYTYSVGRGDEVSAREGRRPADYRMHEVWVFDWQRGQEVELVLRFLPLRVSVVPFLVRAWACAPSWSECVHEPAEESTRDQQQRAAHPFAMNVRDH